MKKLLLIIIAIVAIVGLAGTSRVAVPSMTHLLADSEVPL